MPCARPIVDTRRCRWPLSHRIAQPGRHHPRLSDFRPARPTGVCPGSRQQCSGEVHGYLFFAVRKPSGGQSAADPGSSRVGQATACALAPGQRRYEWRREGHERVARNSAAICRFISCRGRQHAVGAIAGRSPQLRQYGRSKPGPCGKLDDNLHGTTTGPTVARASLGLFTQAGGQARSLGHAGFAQDDGLKSKAMPQPTPAMTGAGRCLP
jgi:hypothetical protein